MKKTAIALASALLVVVLFLNLRPGQKAPVPASPPPAPAPVVATANPSVPLEIAPPPAIASEPAPSAPVRASAHTPTPTVSLPTTVIAPATDSSKAADLNIMHEAMISYDPANLPVIARYLEHRDKELRTAALNNMLQMGDKAAATLLRKAAETAATPQEAVAMLDAAAYLELPSGLELLKKKKAKFASGKTQVAPAPVSPSPPAASLPTPHSPVPAHP